MTEKTVEITLSVLLSDWDDECDPCIEELQDRLQVHKGIIETHLHVDHDPIDLCIHYDPNLISLSAVKRLAQKAGAELSNGYVHEEIPFDGLESADSAIVVGEALENLGGMLHARLNYAAGLALVAYDQQELSSDQIRDTMRNFGAIPRSKPIVTTAGEQTRNLWFILQEHSDLVIVGMSGLFLLIGWLSEMFTEMPGGVVITFYLLSYLTGGFDLMRHAVPAVMRGKFDTDVLMLAAALGAAFLGAWAEGSFLLFLFGLGHAGEHFALERARNAVNALGELMPKTARVRREGSIVVSPVEELMVGEIVIVRPGDRIAVDGKIIRGESAVDQSPITGESMPVQKQPGDEVFAGTINQDAALEVEITRLAKDNTLSRVMEMVAEAQGQQSPTQQFTERFTTWFVPVVLVLVILVAALPPLFSWMPFSDSFYRAMLLLVAASPCALAIGTPAAVLAGIAQAARNGVLIKGGVHLENLGQLKAMAFDKTGTLTKGQFEVTDVLPENSMSADDLLGLAAAVELHSNHPLAMAVVRAARNKNLSIPKADGLENVPGKGVKSRVNGLPVWMGSFKLFEEEEIQITGPIREKLMSLEEDGKTTMLISKGDHIVGVLGLADVPRPNVKLVLDHLRKLGISHLIMLTGDNQKVANKISGLIGVTDVEAELLPQEKLKTIQRLQKKYGAVAMTGDGVNDAPALAAATVGISLGGAGTAVALETADVALMADDLGKLPFAVGLSRASRLIIQQNLIISLGVILLLIVTSVLGLVQLSWAVVLHEGSTIIVVLNALRLLGYKKD
ncbi:MAG: cadmium-transporting ATPase [Anaerolineaceae bacterium]|nr:cadmium-transporting ATPase [Anaerolineaceae bacterium]